MDDVVSELESDHVSHKQSVRSEWLPLVPLGLLALLLGVLVGTLGHPLSQPILGTQVALQPAAPTQALIEDATAMQTAMAETHHFIGDTQAPITIIVFSDFQCHFCSAFATETMKQLQQTYVQSGTVRIGFHPVAYLGEGSRLAAEASECADEQGAFWIYHDLLFQHQSDEYRGIPFTTTLRDLASTAGLDRTGFATCLDSGRYTQRVHDATTVAQQLGVLGTPTAFINGQALIGAQSFDAFEQAIATAK